MKKTIDVCARGFKELNEEIKHLLENTKEVVLNGVFGQRYIGAAMPAGKTIVINGTPGNDMGAYMDGGHIEVFGNGQDAVGNTMNGGRIIIHGSAGDALGYAMRDGEIYVEGNVGYRCGIHMKEFKQACPVIVIGGTAGSFLGEYMAGGLIILLGRHARQEQIVGSYLATGIHGGAIYVRGEVPAQCMTRAVVSEACTSEDMKRIGAYVRNYCKFFGADYDEIMKDSFTKLRAISSRPFKSMYTNN